MIVGIIASKGELFMKLYAALLMFSSTMYVYPMQSPRKEDRDKDKITHSPQSESKEKLLIESSQHKRRGSTSSSKNLNLFQRAASGSPTSSPSNSKIEGQNRSVSMSPEKSEDKKGSHTESRRGSAAHIHRTITTFMGDQSQEQELDQKLQQALAIKNNRAVRDDLLREIVEAKVTIASSSRFKASQALLESAQEEVEVGYRNVLKHREAIKTGCNEMLLARENAILAIRKRLCATNPYKFDEWCWHETFIDPSLKVLTQKMKKFFIENRITEDMRLKDIEVPAHSQKLEDELGAKLTKAKSLVQYDRLKHDELLREILETKMLTPSTNKKEAAQELFVSAKNQLVIAKENVATYERNKYTSDTKTELIKILQILQLAHFATRKKICAEQPLKTDLWCGFETDTDEPLNVFHYEVDEFLTKMKLTEEMKTKDAPSRLLG